MARAKATKNTSNLGRATWKGALKLSDDTMLSIPVKAYTSRVTPPKLKTIHRDCETPIKQQVTCPVCGPIERQDTGKAHEWHKDRLVIFSEDEIQHIQEARDSVLSIAGYVPRECLSVGSAKDKTYYLMPDGAAAQEAYQVFMRALVELNRIAVTEVTITSTSPAAIFADDGILKLTLLEYAENVKAADTFREELLPLDLKPKTVKDAVSLVKRNTIKKFSWSRFEDRGTRELRKLIDSKIESGESTTPGVDVLDLSSAFKRTGAKGKKKAHR